MYHAIVEVKNDWILHMYIRCWNALLMWVKHKKVTNFYVEIENCVYPL